MSACADREIFKARSIVTFYIPMPACQYHCAEFQDMVSTPKESSGLKKIFETKEANMPPMESYYQRILDSKCPAAIRKQIVEFYNTTGNISLVARVFRTTRNTARKIVRRYHQSDTSPLFVLIFQNVVLSLFHTFFADRDGQWAEWSFYFQLRGVSPQWL